nr:MAG TPA: major capsid protein [Caudoviricetes sp.]
MAINTLATATNFQKALDVLAVREAVTGWMEANASQVKYTGGAEVKIPKMSVQGLGDYDRDNGYLMGSATLEYETKKMTQDRGRKFQLDSMDVNETNFVTTASSVMGEFQRTKVIPEIDAYRLSKIATEAINANVAGMVQYGYTPGAANTSALRKVKEGIAAIRDLGYDGPLVIHATDSFILELELELANKISTVNFKKGGIITKVPAVDEVPIIPTPANRLVTAIKLNDGKTSGQEKGGFEKGATAKDINFEIMPLKTPVAISKQDKMRIFDPNTNQKADAWAMDYRRFHDLWILENKVNSIYVSIKDSE